jgi:hypothetical protein
MQSELSAIEYTQVADAGFLALSAARNDTPYHIDSIGAALGSRAARRKLR